MAFLLLSEALTGVEPTNSRAGIGAEQGHLEFGSRRRSDQHQERLFRLDQSHDPTSSFGKLLQLAKDNPVGAKNRRQGERQRR